MANISIGLNGTKVTDASSFLKAFLNQDEVIGPPNTNILHRYRTFNYNVTLAAVSADEYKTQSYKTKGFDFIIFQSHGKQPKAISKVSADIGPLTQGQTLRNEFASTGQGQYNFHLEDLQIKTAFSGQQDWGTSLKLKIIEPYSIDNFMKTCLVAVKAKGYETLEKSCTFVVKIEFVGYKDNNDQDPEVIPFSTRYYPIIIKSIKANLTSAGTSYSIDAAPINDLAKMDDVNIIPERFYVMGNTLGDVMKSLEKQLNEWSVSVEKQQGFLTNRYTIQFAEYSDSGILKRNVETQVSKSKMSDQWQDAGNREFLKDIDAYVRQNPKKQLTESEKKLIFQLKGSDGIFKMIDNLVKGSHFLVEQIRSNFAQIDANGNFEYYVVTPELIPDRFDAAANKRTYTVNFLIVPKKVHKSKITSNVYPSEPKDFESKLARTYEWQFTGNNRDVMSFNLDFNMFWFRIIDTGYFKQGFVPGYNSAAMQNKPLDPVAPATPPTENNSTQASTGSSIVNNPKSDQSNANGGVRAKETDPVYKLADAISKNINNRYEKVMFDMEILGDPMWLGTQFLDRNLGIGNSSNRLFTTDGGFAIRTVEPRIKVLAYAPTDFNSEGFLVAGDQGKGNVTSSLGFQTAPTNLSSGNRELSLWKGYFHITSIESSFVGGVFKQKLGGYRIDTDDQVKPAANTTPGK